MYAAVSSDDSHPVPLACGPGKVRRTVHHSQADALYNFGRAECGSSDAAIPWTAKKSAPETSAASRFRMHPFGCLTPAFSNAISACAIESNAPSSNRRVDFGHSMLRQGGNRKWRGRESEC